MTIKEKDEKEQTAIRTIIGVIIIIWLCSFAGSFTLYSSIFGYLSFSIIIKVWAKYLPKKNKPIRIALSILGDITAISIILYIGEKETSMVFFIYIWVIIGNGSRFGLPYLLFASILTCFELILISISSPYWGSNIEFINGIIITSMVVPIYVSTFIKRLREIAIIAESSNLEKSRFLANMSHELRTPLNGIIGMNELLINSNLTEKQKKFTTIIKESSNHLLELITQVLNISEIENGKINILDEKFDLYAIINQIKDMFHEQVKKKNINIFLYIDPGVPFLLSGSSIHLKQILINIIGNAIKFTEHGHIDIYIDNSTCTTGADIIFSIKDTGIGMTKSEQKRIFRRFTQADTTITRKFGGSGLGTSIAKDLIKLMGGTIDLHSEKNKGSKFTIKLNFAIQEEHIHQSKKDCFRRNILLLQHDSQEISKKMDKLGERYTEIKNEKMLLTILANAALKKDPYNALFIDMNALSCDPESIAIAIRKKPEFNNIALFLINSPSLKYPDLTMIHAGFTSVLYGPVIESSISNLLHMASINEQKDYRQSIKSKKHKSKNKLSISFRILLAEDNLINQTIIREALRKYHLNVANDGCEAINALIENEQYDLILLDLNMPKVDGISVLKKIRLNEKYNKTPVIMISADAIPSTMEYCLNAGANDYITKPINLSKLIRKIKFYQKKTELSPNLAIAPTSHKKQAGQIDKKIINELNRTFSSEKKLIKMVALFMKSNEKYLKNLVLATTENAIQDYISTVHLLLGSTGMMGLKGVAEICKEVEMKSGFLEKKEMEHYNTLLKDETDKGYKNLLTYLRKINPNIR